jgi:succinyl-CoA synthetase alpha subunit
LHGDPATRAILFLGEIGGGDEYEVAEYAAQTTAKPVAALLAGRGAPPGKKMGHAAALVEGYADTHAAKVEALREARVHIALRLSEIYAAVNAALGAA